MGQINKAKICNESIGGNNQFLKWDKRLNHKIY